MGNQASLLCCRAPSDKYELPPGREVEVVAADGLPAKAESCLVEKASEPKPRSGNGAFATSDPMEVAPELAPQHGLPYQFHICGPPLAPCDDMRLRTINALKSAGGVNMDADAIDAPPDPEIASILKLVQSIFEAPAALVALFDDRRIFIRDAEGAFKRGDFPWRWSFCGWTMASKNDQIMVIPDATKDARFCNNEMVKGGPGVRFYCGTPLIASNGHRIGTLCFADVKPREFDASRCVVLNNLAELVVRHLEKDIALQLRAHDNSTLAAAYGDLRRTLDCFEHCVALLDTGSPGWRIMFVNNPCCKALGIERESLQGSYLSRLLTEDDGSMLPTYDNQALADKGEAFQVSARLSRVVIEELDEKEGGGQGQQAAADGQRFVLTFRPASREDLDKGSISIGVPSFIPVEAKKEEPAGERSSADSSGTDSQITPQRRPDKLYFMMLQDAAKLEAERAAAEAKAAADAKAANGSVGLSTAQSSLLSSYSHDKELSQPPESIKGLSMGHLLGKGAYGSVYYGTWYGSAVAVKIIDEELPPGAESVVPPIEAILSKELRHPHIVATLRCACRIIDPSGSSRAASGSVVTATSAALRRSGMFSAGRDGSGATFSDDTARVSQTTNGSGVGINVSGGAPCALPKRRGGISGLASNSSGGLPGSGWLQGDSTSRATSEREAAQLNGAVVSAQGSEVAKPAGDEGTAAGESVTSAALSMQPGTSQSQSQSGWAVITLGAVQPGHRRSSLARRSATGSAVGPSEVPTAANGKAGSLDGSTDGSEAYDDFDAGNDSSMSPFLLPPGSQPAGGGGGGGATGLAGHSGPSGVSDKWAPEDVLIRHQTWLIMEYCDRGCLQDAVDRGWLRNSSALENSGPRMDAVLATALELASALSFLHSKDIVHGDLSAWNVMLCTSGSTASVGGRNFAAKIADFGLARHLDIRTKIQTRTYGTLTHMPAETLRDGVISRATDVYSMGVLLWQMYTSSRPWAGLRHGQIIVMVVTQGARLRFPPDCPPAYEELALSCMEHDPSRRPTIERVLAELESIRKDMY